MLFYLLGPGKFLTQWKICFFFPNLLRNKKLHHTQFVKMLVSPQSKLLNGKWDVKISILFTMLISVSYL